MFPNVRTIQLSKYDLSRHLLNHLIKGSNCSLSASLRALPASVSPSMLLNPSLATFWNFFAFKFGNGTKTIFIDSLVKEKDFVSLFDESFNKWGILDLFERISSHVEDLFLFV